MSSPDLEPEPELHLHPNDTALPSLNSDQILEQDEAFSAVPLLLPIAPKDGLISPSPEMELPLDEANEASETTSTFGSPEPSKAAAESTSVPAKYLEPAKALEKRPTATPEQSNEKENALVADEVQDPEISPAHIISSPIKALLPPTRDVIDLTMDDDDDVLIVEAPFRQVPDAAIKEEPVGHPIINTPLHTNSPGQPTHINAIQPSIETNNQQNPEYWRQALHDYMANMGTENAARSDRATSNTPVMQPDEDVNMDDPAADSEEEDAKALAAFEKLKRAYVAKKSARKASFADDIVFKKAQNAENTRHRLRAGKRAYDEAQFQEDHAMFFPENSRSKSPEVGVLDDLEALSDLHGLFRAGSKPRRTFAANVEADDDSGDLGEPRPRAPRSGRVKRRKRSEKVSKDKVIKRRGTGPRGGSSRDRGGGARRNAGRDLFEMSTLLPYDIVGQARRNREQGPQPGFGTKNKQKALADLIASMPADQQDLHVGERNRLHAATKKFNGHGAMRPDGASKWKLRGMKSSLHHFQVIGTSQMRDMEKVTNPSGGILGYEMGLGKTVMAIANIIDGQPESGAQAKATLIVAPAALLNQWLAEIQKHVDEKVVKNILMYRSSQSSIASDPMAMLSHFDIVITSYHELIKSMPANKPPPHLFTARAKEEWWEKEFEEHKGVLHRIKWHRIILDEAQAIKNHESKTSEAAWRLRGKLRWALSGTPIMNGIFEFFSYFRFLKITGTGDFEIWRKNYCKKGSEKALERLRARLEKFMIRKTHKDQMFGRPILQLPEISTRTVELDFSLLEKTIYRIVRDRFVHKIKGVQGCGGTKGSYQMFFTLLLRLRQLTGHILLVQKTLKDLLETEDLEKLWSLCKPDPAAELSGNDREILTGLETAIITRDQASSGSGSGSSQADQASPALAPRSRAPRADMELSTQFRDCLQMMRDDGKWEEANQRSICHFCQLPPTRPHITSCLHIYCFACLNELAYMATKQDEDEALCVECGLKFRRTEALATQAFEDAGGLPDRDTPTTARSVLPGGRRRGNDSDEEETLDWYTLTPVLQSTKTRAAVQQMDAWFEADETNKILIFSQFRGVLKIFGRICREKKVRYASFHGAMSFDARNRAVKDFTDDPECKVLLAGMKAGGVGLNLTAANRVIIIDLWWNTAAETQAFCRVFRIGQARAVEVVRYAVKNTVDIDILSMQERKTREIASAMEKRGQGGLTTAELLRLFGDEFDSEADGAEDEPFIMPNDPYANEDSDVDEDAANTIIID